MNQAGTAFEVVGDGRFGPTSLLTVIGSTRKDKSAAAADRGSLASGRGLLGS